MAWLLSMMVALSTGVLLPGTATAHTVLKYSNPSAGQVLRTAPAQLELAFNEKLRAGTAQVAVTVGDAQPVEVEIQVDEDNITSDLSAEALPEVPEGAAVRWKIGYRIVSEDGHPVAGVLEFVVDRTLLASSPAEGAVLSSLPPELELNFGRTIASVDPVAVAAGDTPEQQVSAVVAENLVRVSLAELEPAAGTGPQQYRVGYRLTDSTGETLTGLLLFTVDAASGTAPATLAPLVEASTPAVVPVPSDLSPVDASTDASPTAPTSSVEETTEAAGTDTGVPIWILVAVLVLLAAGAAVVVVLRRSRSGKPS